MNRKRIRQPRRAPETSSELSEQLKQVRATAMFKRMRRKHAQRRALLALEEIRTAHLTKRAPESWALEVIAQAYAHWKPARGQTFDQALGLAGAKGKDPAAKALAVEVRNLLYLARMIELRRKGLNVDEAAQRVHEDLRNDIASGNLRGAPGVAYGFRLSHLSASSIKALFNSWGGSQLFKANGNT